MARDAKLLGFILTRGNRYWCGWKNGQWRKVGTDPPKVYADLAAARLAIGKLAAKQQDMTAVIVQPIRCP